MTFYYFINCVLLTFAPLVLVYKFTPLSEYGSIWRSSIAFCGYIVTQICKLLIIATIMAPTAAWDYAIDCLGLYWVLVKQQKASLAQIKILSVALGWSFGESLLTRFVDYYVNARSMQFDWKHIMTAVDANLCLVQNMSLCCLLFLWSRGQKVPLVILLLYLAGLTFLGTTFTWKIAMVAMLSAGTLFSIS